MHQSWEHLLSGNSDLIPSTSPAPAQLSRDHRLPSRCWDLPGGCKGETCSSLLIHPSCKMFCQGPSAAS